MDHPSIAVVVAGSVRIAGLQERIVEVDQLTGQLEHLRRRRIRPELGLGDLPVRITGLDDVDVRIGRGGGDRICRRTRRIGLGSRDDLELISRVQQRRVGIAQPPGVVTHQHRGVGDDGAVARTDGQMGGGDRPVAVARTNRVAPDRLTPRQAEPVHRRRRHRVGRIGGCRRGRRGGQLDDVAGLQRRRIAEAKPRRVRGDQRLGVGVHGSPRRPLTQRCLGDRPVAVTIDDHVLADDSARRRLCGDDRGEARRPVARRRIPGRDVRCCGWADASPIPLRHATPVPSGRRRDPPAGAD